MKIEQEYPAKPRQKFTSLHNNITENPTFTFFLFQNAGPEFRNPFNLRMIKSAVFYHKTQFIMEMWITIRNMLHLCGFIRLLN
jgi:hypothetical protein